MKIARLANRLICTNRQEVQKTIAALANSKKCFNNVFKMTDYRWERRNINSKFGKWKSLKNTQQTL